MSEKVVNPVKNRTLFSVLKWSVILLAVVALEAGGIAAAVKITESRNTETTDKLLSLSEQIAKQNLQINNLEKLPKAISSNEQQIAANAGEINLLSESLNLLKAEVGNKKIELINQQMATLNHRMESVEETKNQEALVLSLALIIKENALYNRSFAQEAAILAELSVGQEAIAADVDEINTLKNSRIANDSSLIEQFKQIEENFSFDKPMAETNAASATDENRGAVAKSIELIKDTVAGINFDKVVVIKKDKKTDEQKLLLQTLSELVNAQNFTDALMFVENNPQFGNAENQEFASWLNDVKQKVRFDKAISQIIAAELNALRQDFQNLKTDE